MRSGKVEKPALLTQREVARELGLSVVTVKRYADNGLLPPALGGGGVGARRRWAAADIERITSGVLAGGAK